MGSDQENGAAGVSLHAFTDVDHAPRVATYIAALEAFDALTELQELKALSRERAAIGPGKAVLPEPRRAVAEVRRVTRPGGFVAAIEPDFGTNAINLPDRALVRRVLDHECDVNVPQGWLVRDLLGGMRDVGLHDVRVDTRIVVFSADLAAAYFSQTGRSARSAGVIDAGELDRWVSGIEDLRRRDRLFCSIGYYLFTARV